MPEAGKAPLDIQGHFSTEEPIRIHRYDPAWPVRFEEERTLLEGAIGPWCSSSRLCFEPLAALGYSYAPYRPEEMHWFCKPDFSRRTHHLHLVPADSSRFRDELAFRDYLRDHPRVASDYAGLKRRLAVQFEDDRESYTEAKGEFVRRILGLAENGSF